jgi:hypothetical protein
MAVWERGEEASGGNERSSEERSGRLFLEKKEIFSGRIVWRQKGGEIFWEDSAEAR